MNISGIHRKDERLAESEISRRVNKRMQLKYLDRILPGIDSIFFGLKTGN